MQKDAELHAEDDKKRRELVETKNQADALIHATEKSLKDLDDKVDSETKANVETEIENVKKALEGDDIDTIKAAVEALTAASHKLAETSGRTIALSSNSDWEPEQERSGQENCGNRRDGACSPSTRPRSLWNRCLGMEISGNRPSASAVV